MTGAGTHLHNLIVEFTGEQPTNSCGCRGWIKRMDRNLAWAKANVELITAKLCREARQRARAWKLEPANKKSNRRLMQRAWMGAARVIGFDMLLRPFVRQMVLKAIARAEEDERNGRDGAP